MSKYIVELKPEYEDSFKGLMILGAKDGNLFVDVLAVDDLELLNSDYINEHFGDLQDEAYQEGYKACMSENDFDSPCTSCEAYQRGLDDAWEAAKKIFGYEMDGGIPINELGKVFGYAEDAIFCTADVIRHNSASEAIDKLKAYEEKQKAADDIKVGDEVNWLGDCFIVTRIFQPRTQKEQCDGIDDDGCVYHDVLMDDLEKTGRHFDIDKILEEMRHG